MLTCTWDRTLVVWLRYKGRGLFLDPPTTGIHKGRWVVEIPPTWKYASRNEGTFGTADPAAVHAATFETYEDLLRPERDATPLAALYRTHVEAVIQEYGILRSCTAQANGWRSFIIVDDLQSEFLIVVMRKGRFPTLSL